jgi:hypothetical protein
MNRFTNIMEHSRCIKHFAAERGLDQDAIYSLYVDCFVEYRENFKQRLHFGKQIHQIISEYRHIPEFNVLRASELTRIIFRSDAMAHWFAFIFWRAIDKQIQNSRADIGDLMIELKFSGAIPSTEIMEEILYEQRTKKITRDRLQSQSEASEAGREESRTGIAV